MIGQVRDIVNQNQPKNQPQMVLKQMQKTPSQMNNVTIQIPQHTINRHVLKQPIIEQPRHLQSIVAVSPVTSQRPQQFQILTTSPNRSPIHTASTSPMQINYQTQSFFAQNQSRKQQPSNSPNKIIRTRPSNSPNKVMRTSPSNRMVEFIRHNSVRPVAPLSTQDIMKLKIQQFQQQVFASDEKQINLSNELISRVDIEQRPNEENNYTSKFVLEQFQSQELQIQELKNQMINQEKINKYLHNQIGNFFSVKEDVQLIKLKQEGIDESKSDFKTNLNFQLQEIYIKINSQELTCKQILENYQKSVQQYVEKQYEKEKKIEYQQENQFYVNNEIKNKQNFILDLKEEIQQLIQNQNAYDQNLEKQIADLRDIPNIQKQFEEKIKNLQEIVNKQQDIDLNKIQTCNDNILQKYQNIEIQQNINLKIISNLLSWQEQQQKYDYPKKQKQFEEKINNLYEIINKQQDIKIETIDDYITQKLKNVEIQINNITQKLQNVELQQNKNQENITQLLSSNEQQLNNDYQDLQKYQEERINNLYELINKKQDIDLNKIETSNYIDQKLQNIELQQIKNQENITQLLSSQEQQYKNIQTYYQDEKNSIEKLNKENEYLMNTIKQLSIFQSDQQITNRNIIETIDGNIQYFLNKLDDSNKLILDYTLKQQIQAKNETKIVQQQVDLDKKIQLQEEKVQEKMAKLIQDHNLKSNIQNDDIQQFILQRQVQDKSDQIQLKSPILPNIYDVQQQDNELQKLVGNFWRKK